jgi:hypothetical protein
LKDLQNWHFLCAMLFVGEYICVLKSRAFQRPPNHILILHESKCLWWSFMSPKGKTLKIFKLHFFLLVMEGFVFTWRLHERFWKTFKIGISFCSMLFVGEYLTCVKKESLPRPPNHILILNESKCLWWSFMNQKWKDFEGLHIAFLFVGYGKFCPHMKA